MDITNIEVVSSDSTTKNLQLTIKQRKGIPVLTFDLVKFTVFNGENTTFFNTPNQSVARREYNDITDKIVIAHTYTVSIAGIKMTLSENSFKRLVEVLKV